MKKTHFHYFHQIIFVFLMLPFGFVSSQTLTSQLDKKQLKLGEVAQFSIKISPLSQNTVEAAPQNELLPFHFEELKDSIKVTDLQYERIIQFSVYDEGKFTIPELEFKVGNQILKTISYEIEVINTSKPTDQISDIRTNINVVLTWADYWEMYKYYLYILLVIIAIIFMVIVILKYGRKPKDTPQQKSNKTLKLLENLLAKKYIENRNHRSFYVELLEISRTFITQQYGIPANVLLTDDLIPILKNDNKISSNNEKIIEEVFTRGDLVKFAKIFPETQTMEKDYRAICELVKNSTQDIELDHLREGV